MKKIIGILKKYIITFFIIVVAFWGALYLTSLIPKSLVSENIKESADILIRESSSYYIHSNFRNIKIDNFTDAIMLNNVFSIDNNNILESIMKCRRNYIPRSNEKFFR